MTVEVSDRSRDDALAQLEAAKARRLRFMDAASKSEAAVAAAGRRKADLTVRIGQGEPIDPAAVRAAAAVERDAAEDASTIFGALASATTAVEAAELVIDDLDTRAASNRIAAAETRLQAANAALADAIAEQAAAAKHHQSIAGTAAAIYRRREERARYRTMEENMRKQGIILK